MSYGAVYKLQIVLRETVLHYANDSKKAAGRALGTIVEIVTYYLLNEWGFAHGTAIEQRLLEYGNPLITHNVEYSLHPVGSSTTATFSSVKLPITRSSLSRHCAEIGEVLKSYTPRNNQLLSRVMVLRNSCLIGDNKDSRLVAFLDMYEDGQATVSVVEQALSPFAMIECKRVGVEEGNKKGPTTIEKAKQGAYVARTVSSLQKIRNSKGDLLGVVPTSDGALHSKPYDELLKEIVNSEDPLLLRDFVLTCGVVSNHGNWFTSNDPNKELRVLAQSYDWLVFLSDNGLAKFINDLILKPTPRNEPIRDAFMASYTGVKGKNQFTKVRMNLEADRLLRRYFRNNSDKIQKWFTVLNPEGQTMAGMKCQLQLLSQKDWVTIMRPEKEDV